MFKSRLAGLLGVTITLFPLLHSPVLRAVEPQPSQPRVVLIGIGKYADKQIKARKHAEADAQALYDLFTNKQYLGADPSNVRLLLGEPDAKRHSEPATRKNILAALEWLAKSAKPDDLTILVFIGEGGPLGKLSDRRCYFGSDSTLKERNKTAIAAADIAERLQKLKSRHFCAFVDVDFKGFVDPKIASPTLGSTPYREFLGDDKTDEHNALPGRVLFLATTGLSVSLDLKEHGLFTTALLAGLKGAADKEGYEPDGLVTVGELTTYLKKELPELATKFGKTKEEKGQRHFVMGDREGATPITTNPAARPKALERLEKLAEKKLPEKFAEEGKKLLSQMPRLKAQQELRKQYQQLVDGGLDVAKFEAKRTEIFNSVKLDPEVAEKFAKEVYKAARLLNRSFVRKVNEGELVAAAVRGLYNTVKEKPSVELRDRLAKAKTLKAAALRTLLVDARAHLGKREDLDNHKDIDIALQRMLRDLKDPYSSYFDPETSEQFSKTTSGEFVGIGVQIRKDRETNSLLVVTPIMGSPAYRAGIRAGDHITSVTLLVDRKGKPLDKPEVISTKGLDVSEAVRRISGKADTPVKLTVERAGEAKPLTFEIKRHKIAVETVLGFKRKANDSWDFMIDPKTKIGYIRLTQFNEPSALDMLRAVKELKREGLRGLVLDLRFNPGGRLGSAKDIADLFIDDGLIVSIRPRGEPEDKLMGDSEGSELRFPMACLINGQSASGSEIVAACLQDHARAVIIGERSYGKGSVQNVMPFAGGQLKLTTASFWPPSGRNLNKSSTKGRDEDVWGVKPNKGYELKLSFKETDDLEEYMRESELILPKGAPRKRTNPEFKDRQLELALKYLRQQVKLADRAEVKKAG